MGCHHKEVHHDDLLLQRCASTQCLYNSALTQIPGRHWDVSARALRVGCFHSHTCLLRLLLNLMALPGNCNVLFKIIFLTKCSTREAILHLFYIFSHLHLCMNMFALEKSCKQSTQRRSLLSIFSSSSACLVSEGDTI